MHKLSISEWKTRRTRLNLQGSSKVEDDRRNINDDVWNAYLFSSWGKSIDTDMKLRTIVEAYTDAEGRINYRQVSDAIEDGKLAHKKIEELAHIVNLEGTEFAKNWIDSEEHTSLSIRIRNTLHHKLKQLTEYRSKQKEKHKNKPKNSKIEATLNDDIHPNDIRFLNQSDVWDIYVDETGTVFNETVSELDVRDKKIGRVVALAIPSYTALPTLGNFHGVDAKFEELDAVIQKLLDAKVGVFGFSVQDETSRHVDWLGHIMHLIRWTLLQLPVSGSVTEAPCKVNFHIEKRGSYSPDLSNTAWEIESEFRGLDTNSHKGLQVTLKFMDKSHPMNGYVDAISNTWGGKDKVNRDRLRKSLWLGRCLLEANSSSLHQLYLALQNRGTLKAEYWYQLCTAAYHEPSQGFLTKSLDKLSEDLASQPILFREYIREVQLRLKSKDYKLNELSHAISWLETHSSKNLEIPNSLQMSLASGKLAVANHTGQLDKNLFGECFEWTKKLHDEEPELSCEILLRMASSATNFFEFNAIENIVSERLNEPVAVSGLKNYGKLESTLGQLFAFQGKSKEAETQFEKAVKTFSRLSNKEEAKLEISQTRYYSYLKILERYSQERLHSSSGQIDEVIEKILDHLQVSTPDDASIVLANKGTFRRFDHHLWMRTMITFPHILSGAIEAYLTRQHTWSSADEHPWGLIRAYRAWLLMEADKRETAVIELDAAIETCSRIENGLTLIWMAEVLKVFGNAIGLGYGSMHFYEPEFQNLKNKIKFAPHEALRRFYQTSIDGEMSGSEIHKCLQECLPFSFH